MVDKLTDIEALILLNQSMILTGLSAVLASNKELSRLMLVQAHTARDKVMFDDKTRQSCGSC